MILLSCQGRVLTMIESSCPSALSRKTKADEVLINIDGLSPRIFNEVNSFVWTSLYNNNNSLGSKGKKNRGFSGIASAAVDTIKIPKKVK